VIRQYAEKLMGTKDVRVDPKLNKAIWAKGVHGVPTRIRVRFSRQRNDDEDAKYKLYTVATYVPVTSFVGMFRELLMIYRVF
jgi:large subunit ribosomal protein L31e